MRSFRRYSTDIPVSIIGDGISSESNRPLYNVSYGGVACHSDIRFNSGDLVTVNITVTDPPFQGNGVVVWCDPTEDGYDVGIQFNEGREAFAARMVAQVCQIEQYKKQVLETEGRELSGDEAAMEWIEKHAHQPTLQERAFIRHPVDVPIGTSRIRKNVVMDSRLRNYSLEGACFVSATEIKLGEWVQIQLPRVAEQESRAMEGVVIWCCERDGKYDVGIKFREEDEIFAAIMFKQVCRLECFKHEVKRREGRELSGEEALSEYAAYLAKMNRMDDTG